MSCQSENSRRPSSTVPPPKTPTPKHAWFDYCRSIFPQSVRKASPDVDFNNVSTYQCSILFNNLRSFERKSECRKPENTDNTISSNEKFHVTSDPQLPLLREFLGNNYAYVILTAEADSLPTDAKELIDDCGIVGSHSSRSNDLSVHARIDSSGYIRLSWESDDDDDRNGHAAIFEVKFVKKRERAVKESRERSAQQLFSNLEPVASAVQLRTLLEPTASCTNDTKKRQLVTRSGVPRLRCCACHLHHKRAMNSPAPVLEFFKTVLQQVYHFKVDVIAGDANATAHKYYKKQEHQDLHNFSVAVMLREMQREVNAGHPFERKLHIDYSTNNHPPQLHAATDLDCCFMAILPWVRRVWTNLKPNHSMNFREQISDLRERTDYPR